MKKTGWIYPRTKLHWFDFHGPVLKSQRQLFQQEFGERLANSLMSAGCRSRQDVLAIIVWYFDDFKMVPGVGDASLKILKDWWVLQPEFTMQLGFMVNS
jgi:hypothetical protein